jgi:hypothetical protein
MLSRESLPTPWQLSHEFCSYSLCIGGCSTGGEVVGAWNLSLHLVLPWLRMSGAVPPVLLCSFMPCTEIINGGLWPHFFARSEAL